MSNLNVEQKSVFELFSNYKADFLIPDYQRSYEWDVEQCETLWDDLYNFALPENDYKNSTGRSMNITSDLSSLSKTIQISLKLSTASNV